MAIISNSNTFLIFLIFSFYSFNALPSTLVEIDRDAMTITVKANLIFGDGGIAGGDLTTHADNAAREIVESWSDAVQAKISYRFHNDNEESPKWYIRPKEYSIKFKITKQEHTAGTVYNNSCLHNFIIIKDKNKADNRSFYWGPLSKIRSGIKSASGRAVF
jgi:hypothetical protein